MIYINQITKCYGTTPLPFITHGYNTRGILRQGSNGAVTTIPTCVPWTFPRSPMAAALRASMMFLMTWCSLTSQECSWRMTLMISSTITLLYSRCSNRLLKCSPLLRFHWNQHRQHGGVQLSVARWRSRSKHAQLGVIQWHQRGACFLEGHGRGQHALTQR